jgi:hypothetical protein
MIIRKRNAEIQQDENISRSKWASSNIYSVGR